jgi:hypothetical protein
MKNYLQDNFPSEKNQMTYKQLRNAVIEAWNSISAEQLNDLINTIHQRCVDVITAEGRHTKW